jgi:hypothetical protein
MAPINLPRRRFMNLIAGAAALPALFASSVPAQPSPAAENVEPTPAKRGEMSNLARAFMQRYAMPGLSVAVGRGGAILYEDAFGWADRETREAVSPTHLFRIASVTKPITSVTVFSLIEEGRIRLTDKIFGPGAITGTDYGRPPYHPGVDEITVEHLLTHTGGGWANDAADPMFRNLEMIPWRMDCAASRPCGFPDACQRIFDFAQHPRTAIDPDHDQRFRCQSQLCERLGGQQIRQLVAYGQPARHIDHCGAHAQRLLLGGVRQ